MWSPNSVVSGRFHLQLILLLRHEVSWCIICCKAGNSCFVSVVTKNTPMLYFFLLWATAYSVIFCFCFLCILLLRDTYLSLFFILSRIYLVIHLIPYHLLLSTFLRRNRYGILVNYYSYLRFLCQRIMFTSLKISISSLI